jgi:hypothetical protein
MIATNELFLPGGVFTPADDPAQNKTGDNHSVAAGQILLNYVPRPKHLKFFGAGEQEE